MDIQRILVAVDYSSHARQATEYAVELASHFGSGVALLHVWERPAYLPEGLVVGRPGEPKRTVAELIKENAEREMAEFLLECNLSDGVDLAVLFDTGEPAAAILRAIDQQECQLVVMGVQGGASVLQHLILGSVTSKVLRLSPVPVVTVPGPEPRSRRGSRRSRPPASSADEPQSRRSRDPSGSGS